MDPSEAHEHFAELESAHKHGMAASVPA